MHYIMDGNGGGGPRVEAGQVLSGNGDFVVVLNEFLEHVTYPMSTLDMPVMLFQRLPKRESFFGFPKKERTHR